MGAWAGEWLVVDEPLDDWMSDLAAGRSHMLLLSRQK